MASLTNRNKQLLRNPPTKGTWVCEKKRVRDGLTIICSTANSRHTKKCFLCGAKKPASAKLLWPEYVQACEKARHTPGERWPVKATLSDAEVPPQARTPRRKRG